MDNYEATERAYMNGYEQGKKDALKWISVKDRLPTAEDALLAGSVYAYTKAKKVLVLHYQYVCRCSDYILCWMPTAMPQPPKGE